MNFKWYFSSNLKRYALKYGAFCWKWIFCSFFGSDDVLHNKNTQDILHISEYVRRISSVFFSKYCMLLRIRQIVQKKQGLNCEKFQIHHKYRKIQSITLSERYFCKKKVFLKYFQHKKLKNQISSQFPGKQQMLFIDKKTQCEKKHRW